MVHNTQMTKTQLKLPSARTSRTNVCNTPNHMNTPHHRRRSSLSAFSSLADLKARQQELSSTSMGVKRRNVRIVNNDAGTECVMTAMPPVREITIPTIADLRILGLCQTTLPPPTPSTRRPLATIDTFSANGTENDEHEEKNRLMTQKRTDTDTKSEDRIKKQTSWKKKIRSQKKCPCTFKCNFGRKMKAFFSNRKGKGCKFFTKKDEVKLERSIGYLL